MAILLLAVLIFAFILVFQFGAKAALPISVIFFTFISYVILKSAKNEKWMYALFVLWLLMGIGAVYLFFWDILYTIEYWNEGLGKEPPKIKL